MYQKLKALETIFTICQKWESAYSLKSFQRWQYQFNMVV